jgi:predicted AAA+ superfamily ATPase
MFQRNALDYLKQWAKKSGRKPLVLRGARQVGKTTLVHEFSKDFDQYLYLNLERQGATQLFETNADLDQILTSIYLFCNQPRSQNKTLLFIDEIQQSPKAVALLRYFYEDFPEIYVIAAGSLLESLIDSHFSFPVGRVEYFALRPCSFSEFLGAMGETELTKAIHLTAVPETIHGKVMQLFKTFTLVGGMPEIISHYAQNKDLVSIRDIYESLLNGYKDDVEKYSRNNVTTHIIRFILQQGWAFAAQRITLGSFAGSSYKSREMGEAFRTLEKTMLLELVYPCTQTLLPAYPELKRSPKLLWLDVGLVNYAAGIQNEVFNAADIMDTWRGSIAEQIVAQELLVSDNKVSSTRSFWVRDKKGADAEVDFVVRLHDKLIPVEVKSGHNSRLRSLHIFMENTNHDIAVRVWSQPFSVDELATSSGKKFRLLNIPFYYVAELDKILNKILTQ